MTSVEDTGDVEVVDNPNARRWEIYVGGEFAGLLNYRDDGDRVTYIHAEIYPRFEGQGLASRMVKAALDSAIGDGKKIVPRCPFVADFVADNPSYAEHVAG